MNNAMRTPTICETWEPTVYVVDKFAHRDSAWQDIVPLGENALTARWLDTDSSGGVNDSDAVCLIWTDGAQAWIMDIESGDTILGPIQINGLSDTRLNVIDLEDDGIPELLCGSRVYDPKGTMLWDGADTTNAIPDHDWDFDDDGIVDSIVFEHGCVSIWNPADSLLLYVSPWNVWPGPVDEVTTDALARIVPAERKCYDASVSWPRISENVADSSVTLTLRIANAGSEPLPATLVVTCYREQEEEEISRGVVDMVLYYDDHIDVTLVLEYGADLSSISCKVRIPGVHELNNTNNVVSTQVNSK